MDVDCKVFILELLCNSKNNSKKYSQKLTEELKCKARNYLTNLKEVRGKKQIASGTKRKQVK